MYKKAVEALTLMFALLFGSSHAEEFQPIEYLCTTKEKAGISALHLEGAGPPKAYADDTPLVRFKIGITPVDQAQEAFIAVELPYDGPDADQYEWHTENSVLHSAYTGDGHSFVADEDQAFFRFYGSEKSGWRFYHAGFEYPGGEDTTLSVRWGECSKLD